MKKSLILVLAAGLVVGLCSMVSAHIGTQIFSIYELPTTDLPDLTDGTLQDWEDVLPGASLNQDSFAPLAVGDGAGINTADLAYRVFFAWHSKAQHLYMAIERVDDVYINTYAGGDLINLWQYDSIEFMVDGDHTGGAYNGFSADEYSAEQIKLLSNYQAQQYVAIAESPDGILIGYQGSGQGWVNRPPYSDAGGFATGESPNTSVIELYVTCWDELNWQGPELSKKSALAADKIVGFQISVPDFDTAAGAYHGFHTLSGQANTWRLAENFVDGQLIGCDTGDCGQVETAVQNDSWGRIKASF